MPTLKKTSLRSIFRKSQFIAFLVMLFICFLMFISLSTFIMKTYVQQNINLLGNTLSERIQPALVFRDEVTLKQVLNEYTQTHSIKTIYVFDNKNNLIGSSTKSKVRFSFFENLLNDWFLKQPSNFIIYHQEKIGVIQIYGSSEATLHFLFTIFFAIFACMAAMLMTLWFSAKVTYRFIMQSIYPLTHIAQLVSDQKAYNLRFPDNKIQEFQNLNHVFNELLSEIQSWHNQLQDENHQLSHQAKHDSLTGLANKSYFYQFLINIFNQPHEKSSAVLLFIDNNNFKLINDRYGHLAGDSVLIEMANRFKSTLLNDCFISRLGGDEFAIILTNIFNQQQLFDHIETLMQIQNSSIQFNKQEILFSFSIGAAYFRHASSLEDLITQADQAMYKAKNSSVNWFIHHSIYRPNDHE
ncbi:diguanylate cyclase domain-containing protein [Acinetobacter rathckeae]|uniref:diguanylate cyclase domain-containing protein n=1 Tax=Acinetobacter rathckeae TaxID=2605272 RepID=UPI0018A3301D|nr:diguanylate cyclase [Acinetobacter rathckeae]MBF7687709.1 diguanylate cyclase [Acinetobacter rathckeae]MBF7688068.1 diguanylate cyclase [Acinetobacter rathckeae]MBF7695923.1 diguanylate cyclase [Acinetobacter rathckeae]